MAPTQLEACMASLISVFHKYAGNEGDPYTLTGNEMKDLLNQEFSGWLQHQNDKGSVTKIMNDLDSNRDGVFDFQEFAVFVISITVACNEHFVELLKKKQKA
ncbi:protein S100-A1-like [Pristis pectinata]|uniref:protein S100-A1-like n=1 Tax=Pristis pectinata TaxID=685728 RepID=UPI00223D5EA0|nr:protein S100-A1-like [Pristis pectinata]